MNGKSKCKILKDIRRQIAADNDIEFVTSECKYQGECTGTCPKCEAEVRYLEQELDKLPYGFTLQPGREKPWGTGHAILIRDFYKCLEEGRPFPISGKEAAKVVRLILSMYQSGGKRIEILS